VVIVDGLVRTVLTRRIAPAQPVSDNEDDAADHQPIINPRNNGKYGSIRRICVFDSKNRSAIVTTRRDTNESANHANRNNLIGPDPTIRTPRGFQAAAISRVTNAKG
jgi:hypothetical protein